MSSERRHCRADQLVIGTPVSVGYAFGPIAGLHIGESRIALRIEGDSLWHNHRPDDPIYLEPAEHLPALQAARTR